MRDHVEDASLPTIDEVPAAHLVGRELEKGWRVVDLITRGKGATGAHFSIPYTVINKDGASGFLKALNFARALRGTGQLVDDLKAFTDAYVFERDLLEHCRERKLTRVIRLLDYGEVIVPEAGPLSRVPYLIFELADGDLREYQSKLDAFDLAWVFRTMKHATQGIEQLHAAHTTHQDLKPSNILTQNQGRDMKLGDLGCAERLGVSGPKTSLVIPGAIAYAPPEQLYGAFDHGWEMRRAGDLYHLGSLAFQLFAGHNMTAMILLELPEPFSFQEWAGDFQGVLPYLRDAHARVLVRFEEMLRGWPENVSRYEKLVNAVREMTDPDPLQRGHPRDRASIGSSYSVRRYVSLFNLLTAEAEFEMTKGRVCPS